MMIEDKDGSVLTNEDSVRATLKGCFGERMNDKKERKNDERAACLDQEVPRISKVEGKRLNIGKAAGADDTPVAASRRDENRIFTRLLINVSECERTSEEQRKSLFVLIPKNKGDVQRYKADMKNL